MKTTNAGSLGALTLPATTEAGASPQTSATPAGNSDFKQLIDQSIGDTSTVATAEDSATAVSDADAVGSAPTRPVAEPTRTSAGAVAKSEPFPTATETGPTLIRAEGGPTRKSADANLMVDSLSASTESATESGLDSVPIRAERGPTRTAAEVIAKLRSLPTEIEIEPATETYFAPTRPEAQSLTMSAEQIPKSDSSAEETNIKTETGFELQRPATDVVSKVADTENPEAPTYERSIVRPLVERTPARPEDAGIVSGGTLDIEESPAAGEPDEPMVPVNVSPKEPTIETDVDVESGLVAAMVAGGTVVTPEPKPTSVEPTAKAGAGTSEEAGSDGKSDLPNRAVQGRPPGADTTPKTVRADGELARQTTLANDANESKPQAKLATTDQPQIKPVPVRKAAESPGPVRSETRRFEMDADSGRYRDPGTSAVRMESLAAARFAAVAGRRYQMAGVDLLASQRGRENPSRPRGIRAAQRRENMNNSRQQNQIAGSPVQNLPVTGREGTTAQTVAGSAAEVVRSQEAVREGKSRFVGSAGDAVGAAMGTVRAAGAAQSTTEVSALSTGAIKTAEQLVLQLTREVVQFKSFNAESMAVILKPDKNTEIFLNLAMRNGAVEVQARFDRGDFAALNSQWSQLQQTMQQQGVKLSSLQESLEQQQGQLNDSAWSQGQNRSQQESGSSQEAFVDSPDEKQIFGSRTEPQKRPDRVRTRDTQGSLEVWA